MKIVAWIENFKNNIFSGWYHYPDQFDNLNLTLQVYIRGELYQSIQFKDNPSQRDDLKGKTGARTFQFSFDEKKFIEMASIGNISFYLYDNKEKHKIRITKDTLARVFITKNKKIGISFDRGSNDGNVKIGSGGTLFLEKGSNKVSDIYKDESELPVENWISIIQSRMNKSKNLNYDFFQIMIPEKSSYLYWKTPFSSKRCSNAYISITKNKKISNQIIDLINITRLDHENVGLFQEFDSHFSTLGAEKSTNYILNKLPTSEVFDFKKILLSEPLYTKSSGDLGQRFSHDGLILDSNIVYKKLLYDGTPLYPEITFEKEPESGVVGNIRVWKCKNAPIEKKIICFGNSFFERGTTSNCLSWWFSRLFKEFHFIWSPTFSDEYIVDKNPDIVIGQTVERFITIPPNN